MEGQMTAAMDTGASEPFAYDPYAPAVMSDPLPFYRELRANHPVYYIEKYDAFYLSRFQDVYDLLSDTDGVFVPSEGTRPPPEVFLKHNDGQVADAPTQPLAPHAFHGSPVYELLRQAQVKPFKPRQVQQLADFIRTTARRRLDVLVPRGRFDLTTHYGGIVAASVMCHLTRVPLEEAKYVLDTINAASITDPVTGGYDPATRWDRVCEMLEPAIRERRREDGRGEPFPIVDGLLDLRLDGRALTDREIAVTIGAALIGGTETVPKVVAHGLWELQQRPEQMAAVRADLATNVPIAFKEMVRYCGPAQWFIRTVRKPTVLAGQPMSPGQRVVFLIPSAARDEREYGPDSEEFRWDRPIKRWVNFGHGQHFCLGYHVALLEGSILVEELLRRVPTFEVDEEHAVRRPSSFQWGWNEIPVKVPIA
jgi:cytochrome P450